MDAAVMALEDMSTGDEALPPAVPPPEGDVVCVLVAAGVAPVVEEAPGVALVPAFVGASALRGAEADEPDPAAMGCAPLQAASVPKLTNQPHAEYHFVAMPPTWHKPVRSVHSQV
jgi:hypothetical protein